jgi:hypothetical protein
VAHRVRDRARARGVAAQALEEREGLGLRGEVLGVLERQIGEPALGRQVRPVEAARDDAARDR